MTEVGLSALEAAMVDGAPVIDVREADEYEQLRVPGATLIPLSQFVERCCEIPDADTVYVICGVGGRSLQAAQYLEARGIHAVSVSGGTTAWMQSGRPVETGV
ncbi:rhodanese-like domain-containing protein [Rhodococcus triatomae]|uniref:Rhodanese-related sulfurtransferase n=1 Tax=Rhodococcus triatomae TaxID=300028 RepID=A0A1G8FM25_9NOCA|nr:rhodanese-like domain-containing protein [Rhodococcus triatomae]QNG19520.1 rhodanese-like domain-containing protein [Rhodococcus triatomae]QNG24565.1 rhodanese-like domain-containing protein [Rhodococcus triatomae]SDH83147.1 Rhodanese-related sulfurtransferase [Rhodococcus triatomae]